MWFEYVTLDYKFIFTNSSLQLGSLLIYINNVIIFLSCHLYNYFTPSHLTLLPTLLEELIRGQFPNDYTLHIQSTSVSTNILLCLLLQLMQPTPSYQSQLLCLCTIYSNLSYLIFLNYLLGTFFSYHSFTDFVATFYR